MAFTSQTTNMGNLPGDNGRKIQWGKAVFSTTDATGPLKLNMTVVESLTPTPCGTPASDEVVSGPAMPKDSLVVGSTGAVTITRTGAAKTSGLVINYVAIGYLLLLGILLAGVAGCTSVNPATGKQELRPPTPAEIQAWDALLNRSVAAVRAAVAAAPPGDRRDGVLKSIDAVTTWEGLGSAIAQAVAAGFTVPAQPTTAPTP